MDSSLWLQLRNQLSFRHLAFYMYSYLICMASQVVLCTLKTEAQRDEVAGPKLFDQQHFPKISFPMSLLYVKILSLCLFSSYKDSLGSFHFSLISLNTLYSESFNPLFLISILLLHTHTQYPNLLIYLSLEPQFICHFLQEFQPVPLGQFPPFGSPTLCHLLSEHVSSFL